MDIKLQNVQVALFFQETNKNTIDIFTDSLRGIFDGDKSIESLPSDTIFDEAVSLRVLSKNEKQILKGTRKRIDYFYNKVVDTTPTALGAHFEEVKTNIGLIRENVQAEAGVKRIGCILNFKLSSQEPIDTSLLITKGVADVVSGEFDNSNIRVVNKQVISGLNSNNVLSLNVGENNLELLCQRDFNTLSTVDYAGLLSADKILEFIEEILGELNLTDVANLFEG
jgi:hypothetical protein